MELKLLCTDEEPPSKKCPNCGLLKSLDEFPNNRATKDGKANYCKPCHNRRMTEIKKRLYGGGANFLRIRRYGIDTAAFKQMVDEQGGLCAICLKAPAVHLDHDHLTGKIRGVLCFSCNRGLGKFGDSPLILRRAAAYVTRVQ
jgi:allantoicase